MADYLVIVESPAKAKTIERYLGKKYKVKASMGHVRDLPKSQMGVDVDNGYALKYITIRGKGETLKELRKEAKKAKRIYLAADPDREGEAIAWHLAQALNVDVDSECRVVFNEITKDAIKESFKHPRKIDYDLVDAQQGRRVLDRLVGYNISPLLWKKVKKGLSAGRVQSVAVKMIIEREKEIRNFTPEEYWSIESDFVKGKDTFKGKFYGVNGKKTALNNEEEVKDILNKIKTDEFNIDKVTKKERRRNPAKPFITSTIQQEAARKLNFRARKTMMVAQQLYEGIDLGRKAGGITGLITYMRTDSTRISPVARQEATQYIEEHYGKQYIGPLRQGKQQEGAQDAHEAIRPTSVMKDPKSLKGILSNDQFKLYKLIYDRFLASQMASAIMDTMSVDLLHDDILFRANGSKIKFDGFMKVYIEGSDKKEENEQKYLPELNEGEKVKVDEMIPNQHFTQPPPRYTEATLVGTLEKEGIGRPSTYAPTLDTIQRRGYVGLDSRRFVPTELGEIVIEILDEFFPEITNVAFTVEMEGRLDLIEEGKLAWVELIDNFYQDFRIDLEKAEKEMETIEVKDEPAGIDCEKCGHPMVYKMGRYGKFMACSNFPECRNTKAIVKKIDVTCPTCKKGDIVERKSKKNRIFYGCDQYPTCEFISWDKPVGRSCPKCEHYLVEKKTKKTTQIKCSSCDYTEDEQ